MLSIQPRSPAAYPAPLSSPQPCLENYNDPNTGMAPMLVDAADPPTALALASMVILSEGCSLQLPLDGFNLVVEAMPDSVLQVTLQDHTLILGPHHLLGSNDPGPREESNSLEVLNAPCTHLDAPLENDIILLVEEEGFCTSVPEIPEIASHEEVQTHNDEHPVLLEPYGDLPAGFTAGLWPTAVSSPHLQGSFPESRHLGPIMPLESGSPGLIFDQDYFHLLRPFPTSLQPMPPFPSPGPQERPVRLGPHRKARRRLFQE